MTPANVPHIIINNKMVLKPQITQEIDSIGSEADSLLPIRKLRRVASDLPEDLKGHKMLHVEVCLVLA